MTWKTNRIDGQDIAEVRKAVEKAVKSARKDKTPTLIEAQTYRYRGHSMIDPGRAYRTREEVEEWKEKNPIQFLEDKLLTEGTLTEEKANELDLKAKEIAQESVDFAQSSPEPTAEMLTEDVYA